MTPFHDFVLIRILDNTPTSAGGLYIAQTKTPFQRGIVEAIGPGATGFNGQKLPMHSRVGDEVLFSSDVETFTQNGEVFTLIKDAYIMARVY